jgi:hypothetical protein
MPNYLTTRNVRCVYPGALDHLRAFHLQNRSGGTRTRTGDTMIFRHIPYFTVERCRLRWDAFKPNLGKA